MSSQLRADELEHYHVQLTGQVLQRQLEGQDEPEIVLRLLRDGIHTPFGPLGDHLA